MPSDFLNQVSVFETLRVYGGKIFCWDKHLERFSESCLALGKILRCPKSQIKDWLEESLRDCGLKDASMRLSLHWSSRQAQALVLFLRYFESHPIAWYEKGVEIRSSAAKRWTLKAQDPQIKASQYVSGVLAMLDKGELAAHELLFLGPAGSVAEGTVSNIFMVREKRLLTPCASSGILKGVTRGIVLDLARKRGIETAETHLTRHEFYTADECFLTNTSSEVLPITRFDGRVIGGGLPGPITAILGQDFKGIR